MIPPAFIYLRVPRTGRKPMRMLVPVVLLWPLLIPLAMAAEIICLAAAAAVLPFGRARARKLALLLPRLNEAVCALPGLAISVSAPGRGVEIRIR